MTAKKKTDDLDEEILERLEGGVVAATGGGPGAGMLAIAGLLPLLAMGAVFVFLFCIARVPAGHVGVAYSVFGGVLPVEYEMGWHLKWPWIDITLYSIQTQDYTMSLMQGEGKRTGDDRISALTSEGLNVDLDLTVLFKIEPDKADVIHTTLGETYDEKVIRTNIRSTIRKVAAT
ncbi:MAG: SPFH domain-containing protein, partial [Methanopyri archaeon]|nr:SPFH domain-containing protein [Methanopyri archaeon]